MEKLDKTVLLACIESMKECLKDAPIDFLGTGSDSTSASLEEMQWRDKWQQSYIEAQDILNKK